VTLAIGLEHVVLRTRAAQLADEVRQFSASAQALAREVREAPTALPSDHGLGASFPAAGRAATTVTEMFSLRERSIAALVAEGRTNREIAEALVLSPETVKSHVSRILRKLGAANRVEAAGRYLRLAEPGER
jgi:DNA-binding NarL/FixJ family response regulator